MAKEVLKKAVVEYGRDGEKFRFLVPYLHQGEGGRTILSVHGAPGSHADFKHFAEPSDTHGFTHISPNQPGFGVTSLDGQRYQQKTGQKVDFFTAFMDNVIPRVDVLMGHSAGCFHMPRLLVEKPSRAKMILLINPGGISAHRGMRPVSASALFGCLWEVIWLRWLLRPILYLALRYIVGLRLDDGDIAAACTQTVAYIRFKEQAEAASQLGLLSSVGVLMFYSGRDPLIERERYEELASALCCGPPIHHQDDEQTLKEVEGRLESGSYHNAVFFPEDGHFCQKYRAGLATALADAYLKYLPK